MSNENDIKIKSALGQLDHDNDKHWTKGGEPDLATVMKLADLDGLKRADVQRVEPDFKRRAPVSEDKKSGIKEFERETVASTSNRAATDKARTGKSIRKMDVFKEVGAMTVRATRPGYYEGDLKAEGDVFLFKGGRPGSWMEPC